MSDSDLRAVNTQWLIEPASIPAPVNQILIQGGMTLTHGEDSGEYVLSFGYVSPPVVAELDPSGELNLLVVPVARMAVTWDRLVEMSQVLASYVARNGGSRTDERPS